MMKRNFETKVHNFIESAERRIKALEQAHEREAPTPDEIASLLGAIKEPDKPKFKPKQWLKDKVTPTYLCQFDRWEDSSERFFWDSKGCIHETANWTPATYPEIEAHFSWTDKWGTTWLVKQRDSRSIAVRRNSDAERIWSKEYSLTVLDFVTTLMDQTNHEIMPDINPDTLEG